MKIIQFYSILFNRVLKHLALAARRRHHNLRGAEIHDRLRRGGDGPAGTPRGLERGLLERRRERRELAEPRLRGRRAVGVVVEAELATGAAAPEPRRRMDEEVESPPNFNRPQTLRGSFSNVAKPIFASKY